MTSNALRGGRWVKENGVQVWRRWRDNRPECGIMDCTAQHVPWDGMPNQHKIGA